MPSVIRLLLPRYVHNPARLPTSAAEAKVLVFGAHTTSPLGRRSANPVFSLFSALARPRAVALDCDVNLHKSNSTFFADADVSRAAMLTRLFAPALVELGRRADLDCAGCRDGQEKSAPAAGRRLRKPVPASLLLASTQATFLRPVPPYGAYDVTTRVLGWDCAALWTVTYFSRPGSFSQYRSAGEDGGIVMGPAAMLADEGARKATFALVVSRYVVRKGREKVCPRVLVAAVLGDDKAGETLGKEEWVEALEGEREVCLEYLRGCML